MLSGLFNRRQFLQNSKILSTSALMSRDFLYMWLLSPLQYLYNWFFWPLRRSKKLFFCFFSFHRIDLYIFLLKFRSDKTRRNVHNANQKNIIREFSRRCKTFLIVVFLWSKFSEQHRIDSFCAIFSEEFSYNKWKNIRKGKLKGIKQFLRIFMYFTLCFWCCELLQKANNWHVWRSVLDCFKRRVKIH